MVNETLNNLTSNLTDLDVGANLLNFITGWFSSAYNFFWGISVWIAEEAFKVIPQPLNYWIGSVVTAVIPIMLMIVFLAGLAKAFSSLMNTVKKYLIPILIVILVVVVGLSFVMVLTGAAPPMFNVTNATT